MTKTRERYWPLGAGRVVTSEFGQRWGEMHWGIDLGRDGGSAGMPVYAAQAGTVVKAGPATGFGQWVVMDHPTEAGSGATVYGHVIPEVTVGELVAAGQRIARVNPDRATNGRVDPHLHFEVHRYEWVPPGLDRLDPLPWLADAAEPESTGGKAMGKPDYVELDRMGRSASSRHGARVENFLLHTQEGNGTAESLADYLNNPANGVSYHYTVRDRIVVDVVDTDLASWSVLNANPFTINLCFAGSRAAWSRAEWLRIRDDIEIAAWLAVQDARKYGFATTVIAPPYRRGPGISDHRYVTECLGIGTHTDVGPNFPWDVFAADVRNFANTQEDDMPSADDIAKAVWAHRVRKPGARDGQNEDGIDNETAGNMLGWNDLHAGAALDQLGGLGSKENRNGGVTGFEQLGGRSVVDALAVIGERLGIAGFQDPHGQK
ncbi:M23 family metallopeptidase [Nocardia abscessus]|uniref:M23 family metallopeptidase n=1 Tax=Nocardia abscessus TaxID=120957 RepID=UPI002453E590|nr:M23 family metallopeptidase [Nocardia abscessus]